MGELAADERRKHLLLRSYKIYMSSDNPHSERLKAHKEGEDWGHAPYDRAMQQIATVKNTCRKLLRQCFVDDDSFDSFDSFNSGSERRHIDRYSVAAVQFQIQRLRELRVGTNNRSREGKTRDSQTENTSQLSRAHG